MKDLGNRKGEISNTHLLLRVYFPSKRRGFEYGGEAISGEVGSWNRVSWFLDSVLYL